MAVIAISSGCSCDIYSLEKIFEEHSAEMRLILSDAPQHPIDSARLQQLSDHRVCKRKLGHTLSDASTGAPSSSGEASESDVEVEDSPAAASSPCVTSASLVASDDKMQQQQPVLKRRRRLLIRGVSAAGL